MKKLFSAAIAALLLLSLSACAAKARRCETTYLDLFDTVTTVVAYRGDETAFSQEARAIHNELLSYHRLYDIYNDYEGLNNLKTVNDNAGVAPVEVDEKIIGLLLRAKELYALTDGRMNIAMGSVLSVWHDYREAGLSDPDSAQLPPMELLEEAEKHTDLSNVIIDEEASTVYLADPELRLDVGAIAKGYAAEQVCRSLEENGSEPLLLSVGGNVRAVGAPESGGWTIGVQDPHNTQAYLWTVSLDSASLVTSGDYQRYYTVDGVNYHHIIDPDTLFPAAYCASVTVLTTDSGLADALSTALFTLPPEEGLALTESLEDVECLWVLPDGSILTSSGFPANLAG